ncbi:unnamed protein product, partial [Iphiclides podalirius]
MRINYNREHLGEKEVGGRRATAPHRGSAFLGTHSTRPTEIEGRKEISWPFAVGECATNEAQREKKQIYTAVGRGHGSGTFGEVTLKD